ncbi:hypothetical protein [Sphingorhabdus sp. EL138]|uniref:hypothetical protein n=1 Tax=Sphingorhabdus sp. EL138 TaxID=2073156 RepID=UPI000D686DCA|nr:hypothetical protein [Sphingorhabdus sp. EL138]
MNKLMLLSAIAGLFTLIAEPVSAQTPDASVTTATIPAGTEIPMVMGEAISSKTHVKGDLFHLLTTQPLEIDGAEIIPKDTRVMAELVKATKKGAFGRSGKLEARLLYAELENRTLRLQGTIGARGKGGTTETVLAAIAIGTLAFVVTGKSANIKKGTELSGYLTSAATLRLSGN